LNKARDAEKTSTQRRKVVGSVYSERGGGKEKEIARIHEDRVIGKLERRCREKRRDRGQNGGKERIKLRET